MGVMKMERFRGVYVKVVAAVVVIFALVWAFYPGLYTTRGVVGEAPVTYKATLMGSKAPASQRTLSAVSAAPESGVSDISDSGSSSADFGWVVLKSGRVSVPVDDKDKIWDIAADVDRAVKGCGGVVVSQHRQSGEYPRFDATYRVPADGFEACVENLSRLYPDAEVSVSSEDKTGEYVDITARLRVLEAERDFYERLLAKAETVDDMLKVKRALDQVITKIETLKARQQYLEDHAKWSTLSVSVYFRPKGVKPEPWWVKDLKDALHSAGMILWRVLMGLLVGAIVIVPIAVIVWLVIKAVARMVVRKGDARGAGGKPENGQNASEVGESVEGKR